MLITVLIKRTVFLDTLCEPLYDTTHDLKSRIAKRHI